MSDLKIQYKIIIISLLFGIFAWLADAIVDFLIFYHGSFLDILILNVPSQEYNTRVIILLLFIVSGLLIAKFFAGFEEMKEELNYEKKKLNTYLQISDEFIIGLDSEGIINLVNKAGEKILGYSRKEIIGSSWFTKFIPERKQYDIRKVYEKLMKGEEKLLEFYENPIVTKEGEERLFRWHNTLIRNSSGRIIGTISSGIDVTEGKNNSDELKELSVYYEKQNELLEKILTSAPDYIYLFDKEGKYIYSNFHGAELFGLDRFDMIGKTWRELNLDDEGMKLIEAKRELAMLSGNIITDEIKCRTKLGTRNFEYILTPIKNNLGAVENVVCTARDISEKKSYEEELVSAKQKAQSLDKLKSEFLAQISHEIRTPLHTILSYISLIKDELSIGDTKNFDSSFDSINSSSRRLTRTIDMILNMSQIQAGTYIPDKHKFDIAKDIIAAAVSEMENYIKEKNIKLEFNCDIENPIVYADRYTLSHIFLNLIENAVKYTLKGKISITVFKNDSGKTCVEVKDTGIGISQDYLDEIFDPFSQENTGFNRTYEGSGLGLALVKNYCLYNNAEIKVKSEKGKGSNFTIVFNE